MFSSIWSSMEIMTNFYYSKSVCDQKWKCKQKDILRNFRTVCLNSLAVDTMYLPSSSLLFLFPSPFFPFLLLFSPPPKTLMLLPPPFSLSISSSLVF